ncbi:unnamed protein product [Cochlearia groenlandica]
MRSRVMRPTSEREKKSDALEISQDILIEILIRLPSKSIVRFKCVSKLWSQSLFNSRYFCNRFLVVASSQQQPRIYMSLHDVDDYTKSMLLSTSLSSSSSLSSPMTCLEFNHNINIPEMGGYDMHIIRGLICFTGLKKAQIYNPCTRQLVTLPNIELYSDILAKENIYSILYYPCHDLVNDKYKVLCTITAKSHINLPTTTIRSERWVLVLEAGSSWKRIAKDDLYPHHIPRWPLRNMNGVLYYSALIDIYTLVLVSFDIRSENFDMVQVPCKPGNLVGRIIIPIEYNGKIAIVEFFRLGIVELLIVEDWSNREWSRKNLVMQPSQSHLFIGYKWKVKSSTLKNKVMFLPQSFISPFYFISYDLQTNDLTKVEIKGIPDDWFSNNPNNTKYFDMVLMDQTQGIMYLET